jgi:peptide/nickel transport system permease protein/glutathione transport system permease protein
MLSFITRRIMTIPISMLLVSALAFTALRLTGNPVDIYLDINRTQEQVDALTEKLRLNEPIIVQYVYYLKDLIRGDFGHSLQFAQPALDIVIERAGASFELLSAALLIAVLLGVTAGTVGAVFKDRLPDFVISTTAVASQSMPSFWLGIILIQVFAVQLNWLPTSGRGGALNLILPATTLAAFLLPSVVLITRTSMLETFGQQFIVTATAKGVSKTGVLFVHALRNALNPIISFVGMQVGRLMGGAIITETLFAWPGVGRLLIGSIFQRDVPVVIAGVLLVSLVIVLANLLVDILLSFNDPRIRLG